MVKGLVIHYYPPKGLAEPLDKCLADSSTRTKSNRVMQNATEMISQLIHNPPSEKQHLSVFDWQAHNLIRTSKAASQDDTCNKMIFKKVCSNRKKNYSMIFEISMCFLPWPILISPAGREVLACTGRKQDGSWLLPDSHFIYMFKFTFYFYHKSNSSFAEA